MTLAIAVAGVVLALISLAFTAYQWRREGPALKIEVEMWSAGPKGAEPSMHVQVISTGRMAVTVTRLAVNVFGTGGLVYGAGPWSPTSISHELPARLEPTDVVTAVFGLQIDRPAPDVQAIAMVESGGRWMSSVPEHVPI
jgi:hypothetical protein